MNRNKKEVTCCVRYRRNFFPLLAAAAIGVTAARADSPVVTLITPNTSLLKSGNWAGVGGDDSGGNPPTAGQTGTIAEGASANPLGWNSKTNAGASTIGDLDFISGSTSLVIGNYYSSSSGSNVAVNITLGGSTLNSQTNTVIANSSGNTIVFENDVAPSGDYLSEAALTTFTLGNTTNTIQSTATSNIIIDNVITGTSDALSFLGGGNSGTTGATLELGAGSANDVTGAVAPNAPTPANGGSFSSSATVQSSDTNSFTGGLTIGDVGGTANAGVVKIDGAHALPTSGTVTVNANSQLLLNGSATYGGASQSLALNGTGTPGTAGALTTASGNSSTWQGTINVASGSSTNVQGSTGSLIVSGSISGSSQLQKTGAGSLTLNGSSGSFSGGLQISQGSLVAGNASALGTGAVTVAGGTLSSSLSATPASVGGTLSISTGVIQLLAQSAATFSLASAQNFTMSGGTLDTSDSSGNVGKISSAGGGSTLSITSGVLDLGGNTWNYASTYQLFSGFGSGSVSGLSITDYDSSDYTANLSNTGVLSFTPTPEPSAGVAILGGLGMLLGFGKLRRGSRKG